VLFVLSARVNARFAIAAAIRVLGIAIIIFAVALTHGATEPKLPLDCRQRLALRGPAESAIVAALALERRC